MLIGKEEMELCKSCEMQCQRLVVCFWPENARDGVVTRRPRLAADGNCEHVSAPRSLTFSFHSPILSLLLVFLGNGGTRGGCTVAKRKEERGGRCIKTPLVFIYGKKYGARSADGQAAVGLATACLRFRKQI